MRGGPQEALLCLLEGSDLGSDKVGQTAIRRHHTLAHGPERTKLCPFVMALALKDEDSLLCSASLAARSRGWARGVEDRVVAIVQIDGPLPSVPRGPRARRPVPYLT